MNLEDRVEFIGTSEQLDSLREAMHKLPEGTIEATRGSCYPCTLVARGRTDREGNVITHIGFDPCPFDIQVHVPPESSDVKISSHMQEFRGNDVYVSFKFMGSYYKVDTAV